MKKISFIANALIIVICLVWFVADLFAPASPDKTAACKAGIFFAFSPLWIPLVLLATGGLLKSFGKCGRWAPVVEVASLVSFVIILIMML